MSWRYVLASVAGTQHQSQATPCQDYCLAQTQRFDDRTLWWAVVSDGAGSAPSSATGAALVCHTVMAQIAGWLAEHHGDLAQITAEVVELWFAQAVAALVNEAAAAQPVAALSDYSATLLAVVADEHHTVAFQVGDGAIVAQLAPAFPDNAETNGISVLLWPNQGEYINTTHFVTDVDAAAHLCVRCLPPARCIAIFTDGLQQLALHYATQTAHAPFFAGMFARLAQEPPGCSDGLNHALVGFLESPAVNQRTTDDKTLVLACND